jgi:hypothetical protein
MGPGETYLRLTTELSLQRLATQLPEVVRVHDTLLFSSKKNAEKDAA